MFGNQELVEMEEREERRRREERVAALNMLPTTILPDPEVLPRRNPFQEFSDDEEFRQWFRFTKGNVQMLVRIFPELEPDRRGVSPLNATARICLFLSYCGGREYQYRAGRFFGVKKTTASRIIREVAEAISKRSREFIRMPDAIEMQELAEKVERKFKIPRCPLGVDGSMIKLSEKPWEDNLPADHVPQNYWSRKQKYALNVQYIGDINRQIRDVVETWAGSTHDGRIWANSQARMLMEAQLDEEDENGVVYSVAGDSAYLLSRVCLKGYNNPVTDPQKAFNYALSGLRTESTECIFGECLSLLFGLSIFNSYPP